MPKEATLVILSPGFPQNESDDTCLPERQVFVRNLKQTYPQLDIIVLSFQYPYMARCYNWNGVSVISFGGKNKGKVYRLLLWYKVWNRLKHPSKEKKIIGLLSFWLGECAFVGAFFARRFKLRHYCWLLGQDARPGNSYVKLIAPKPESLIAISDFIATEFCRNYKIKPSHIITSGIDTTMFLPKPEKRNIDVLGVGSLIPLKQFHLFITIIGALKASFPHIRACICGQGLEKNKLKRQVKSLNLESNITFLNEVPHRNVLQLMQQSKVFLHPSSYEGWSTVCMEALYAGAQVVSFCRPMQQGIAHLHIANSPDTMVETIRSILSNNETDHASVLPYSINSVVAAIMKLYPGDVSADRI